MGSSSSVSWVSHRQDLRSRELFQALTASHCGSAKGINLPVAGKGFKALLFLFISSSAAVADCRAGRRVPAQPRTYLQQ